MLWVLIRSAHRGASNEYPQHMFLRRNKKVINIFVLEKSALSEAKSMAIQNVPSEDAQMYRLI